jgi:hypothetical protein
MCTDAFARAQMLGKDGSQMKKDTPSGVSFFIWDGRI